MHDGWGTATPAPSSDLLLASPGVLSRRFGSWRERRGKVASLFEV
jgi:hypothetical protein